MSTVILMIMGNTIALEFDEDLDSYNKEQLMVKLFRPVSHRIMIMADFIFTMKGVIVKNREPDSKSYTISNFLNFGENNKIDHLIKVKDDNSHMVELNTIVKCCENVRKWGELRRLKDIEFKEKNEISISLGGKTIYIDAYDFKNKDRLKELNEIITVHADKEYILTEPVSVEVYKMLHSILRLTDKDKQDFLEESRNNILTG